MSSSPSGPSQMPVGLQHLEPLLGSYCMRMPIPPGNAAQLPTCLDPSLVDAHAVAEPAELAEVEVGARMSSLCTSRIRLIKTGDDAAAQRAAAASPRARLPPSTIISKALDVPRAGALGARSRLQVAAARKMVLATDDDGFLAPDAAWQPEWLTTADSPAAKLEVTKLAAANHAAAKAASKQEGEDPSPKSSAPTATQGQSFNRGQSSTQGHSTLTIMAPIPSAMLTAKMTSAMTNAPLQLRMEEHGWRTAPGSKSARISSAMNAANATGLSIGSTTAVTSKGLTSSGQEPAEKAAAASPPITDAVEGVVAKLTSPPPRPAARLRMLRKKLKQILELVRREAEGKVLSSEEMRKLEAKAELEAQIHDILLEYPDLAAALAAVEEQQWSNGGSGSDGKGSEGSTASAAAESILPAPPTESILKSQTPPAERAGAAASAILTAAGIEPRQPRSGAVADFVDAGRAGSQRRLAARLVGGRAEPVAQRAMAVVAGSPNYYELLLGTNDSDIDEEEMERADEELAAVATMPAKVQQVPNVKLKVKAKGAKVTGKATAGAAPALASATFTAETHDAVAAAADIGMALTSAYDGPVTRRTLRTATATLPTAVADDGGTTKSASKSSVKMPKSGGLPNAMVSDAPTWLPTSPARPACMPTSAASDQICSVYVGSSMAAQTHRRSSGSTRESLPSPLLHLPTGISSSAHNTIPNNSSRCVTKSSWQPARQPRSSQYLAGRERPPPRG